MPQVRPTWVLAKTRFLVRTEGDPTTLAPLVRERIRSEDPQLSVASLNAGPELVSRTLVRERMMATLLVAFGALAAGLACLGLYGLMAYHVVQRTSEIGIRMALGARRGDVLTKILWRGLSVDCRRPCGWHPAGFDCGSPRSGLPVRPGCGDPGTLTAAVTVMSATGVLAAYIPAWRASRVDPLSHCAVSNGCRLAKASSACRLQEIRFDSRSAPSVRCGDVKGAKTHSAFRCVA